MRKPFLTLSLLIIFITATTTIFAQAVYYVSPTGSDVNAGSITLPFLTIRKAMSVAGPGVTIYVRGGVYTMSTPLSTATSGTKASPINVWAYPGETPILDFSGEPYVNAAQGIQLNNNYWYLKGLTVKNAGDNGIYISGNNNIVENCQVSWNKDTGIQISNGGSYNYLHNCDAFDNYDPATGGQNADGIDVKLDAGPGNVLRGCRAFDNADDGYDCYQTANRVVFDSCWSFHNGYNLWDIQGFTGNGNGFKLGGNFVPGPHLVTNCISFDNTVKGFDQNNNTAGVTLYNNTSFRNGTYDFSFPTLPSVGQDTLMNNVAYQSNGVRLDDASLQQNNTWNLGLNVASNDFISIDTAFARIVRLSDGTLPPTTFLRLDSSSALIDAGINIGIPYLGKAPDLGAFESGSETFQTQLLPLTAAVDLFNVTLNWQVAFEFNNPGWTIQRASLVNGAASSWKDIGFTTSLGNTALLRSYTFNDSSITHFGTYQYRLKQLSVGDTVSYSNVLVVNVEDTHPVVTATTPLIVFPNPVADQAIIQFYIPQDERVSISVYNYAGQLMQVLYNNWYFYNGNTYNIPFYPTHYPAGIYYVKFSTEAGVKSTFRIIKL